MKKFSKKKSVTFLKIQSFLSSKKSHYPKLVFALCVFFIFFSILKFWNIGSSEEVARSISNGYGSKKEVASESNSSQELNQNTQNVQKTQEQMMKEMDNMMLKGKEREEFFALQEGEKYYGSHPSESKAIVIAYLSPSCPHCISFRNNKLKNLINRYGHPGSKVTIIERFFVEDIRTAKASIALQSPTIPDNKKEALLDSFYSSYDWLLGKNFEENIVQMCQLVGGNPASIKSNMNNNKKIESVGNKTKDIVFKGGLRGTPFILLNYESLEPKDFSEIENKIDKLIG